jgi:hypothetical protein
VKRRCRHCKLPASSPWLGWWVKVCRCEWNKEATRWAKMQMFPRASRVWRENTFDVPDGCLMVMGERKGLR